MSCDFNPRIPYGMRRERRVTVHAVIDFNPRIPYGMRPAGVESRLLETVFQSTHPVWDATRIRRVSWRFRRISIHASRMGCDADSTGRHAFHWHFNPRIPYGMRPEEKVFRGEHSLFQSTHPVWDATRAGAARTGVGTDFNPRIPYGMRLRPRRPEWHPA